MIEKLLKDALEMVRNGSHLDMAAQKIEQAMELLSKDRVVVSGSKETVRVEPFMQEIGTEISYDMVVDPLQSISQEKREKRRGK